MNSCIVRYSEIGLKGKNRIRFEKKLMNNLRSCLDKNRVVFSDIKKLYGRILITGIKNSSCAPLACVFGVSSFSEAVNVGNDMDNIKKFALQIIKSALPDSARSFSVFCQRLDKSFPFGSLDFAGDLGFFIQQNTGLSVNLKNPDIVLYAEIIEGCVYLFTEKIKGLGGLPSGIEGVAVVKIDNTYSLLSGLLMMKRGCEIFCIGSKKIDISLLQKFAYGSKVMLKILDSDREIDFFAKEKQAKAIIVDDSLDSMNKYDFEFPVFRPLSAFNKQEVEARLNEFRQKVCSSV